MSNIHNIKESKALQNDEEISLIDLLVPLIKNYKIIAVCILISICVGFVYLKTSTKTYLSTATITPLSKGQPNVGSMMGQITSFFGQNTANDGLTQLVIYLETKTLARRVYKSIMSETHEYLYPEVWNENTQAWEFNDQIKSAPEEDGFVSLIKGGLTYEKDPKNPVIRMNFESKDPVFSQKVISTFVDELNKYLNDNDVTIAQRNKTFIKEQLLLNKKNIFEEAKVISQFHQNFSIQSQNPMVKVNLSNLDSSELITNGKPELAANSSIKHVPADVYLDYLNNRQLLLKKINAILEEQYQAAKITAEREKLLFQLLDEAEVPRSHFKPSTKLAMVISIMLGVVAGLAFSYTREFLSRNRKAFVNELKDRIA